jgi:hypothetical protein
MFDTGGGIMPGRVHDSLDAAKIIDTIDTLRLRVVERFPQASLTLVAADLVTIAREAAVAVRALARPNVLLRTLVLLVTVVGATALLALVRYLARQSVSNEVFGILQGIDAGVSIVIVTGGALFYLVSLETRLKRHRCLRDLHRLRSIIHVIDMHQLTKDPSATLAGGAPTRASPNRTLTPFELMRYLDYCSEMLSLIGKLSALYAQGSHDAVVVSAVNDIEQLASNLSQKIWQKIMIVQATSDSREF